MRALVLLSIVLSVLVAPSARAQDFIELVVIDKAGILEENPEAFVYMPNPANVWDPASWRSAETRLPEGGEPGSWLIRIPMFAVPPQGLEYKITLGTWLRTELNADGSPRENRLLEKKSGVVTIEVPAFSDDPEPVPTVVGERLDVFKMTSPRQKVYKWLRVWLPPGYDTDRDRRYPVLYMHDGQNLFDEVTAFGEEWGVDETVVSLMEKGVIEPMIVVGIDNSGRNRSQDYLPFDAGSRAPNVRGGQAPKYADFIVNWVKPKIDAEYRTKPQPEFTGLGGSSLGGIITLYTAMWEPGVFGRLLVESPSLWVGDGQFQELIEGFDGRWPERVFIGMGGAEYGDDENDAELRGLAGELAEHLEQTPGGPEAVELVVEEGAGHNEAAWRGRLPQALEFLFAPAGD